MLSHESKQLRFRKSFLAASAAAAVLACGSQVAWAQDAAKSSTSTKVSSSSDGASQLPNAVGEVVVTGTNIKGVRPIAPAITITRQDIDDSGYATIGDVIRSLPEDFAGGQNPGTLTASGINNQNITNGSSVNLFGLGSEATLTLIDGHRMPSDGFYSGSDISVIPLGAIQRVEVVTDGSSAIYGSDAVAGVVNFILRKDYNGLETSAYYGGATEGGGEEQIYSILGGVVRDNWHVMVSAEYEHEDPITASERDFTSGTYGPTTLIQSQTSRTVFVSGGVNLTDKIKLSLDALYNNREAGGVYGESGIYSENEQEVSPNVNVNATLEFILPRDWNIKISATDARSENIGTEQEYQGSSVYKDAYNYFNSVSSLEATATGTIALLPTGELRTAVGAGYREEGFKADYPGDPSADIDVIHASRSIAYAYGEALVPIVPISADRLGLEKLELSVSGRYEHYSDFGDTANPRLGIRYVPISGLTLRGTWGTSFKAPSFDQQYQITAIAAYSAHYWNYPGNALEVLDGNRNLKPERSTNWTIGADYIPPGMKSMVISLTYFDIDYTDRIVTPLTGVPDAAVLANPEYAQFVIENPSIAVVQNTINSAGQIFNYLGSPINASTIDLILDYGYQNAVAQVDTGVDISYRQRFLLGSDEIRTFANATWNHLSQQLSKDAPVQTLSGTIFNVPSFKARAGVSWSNYGLTASAIVNYTSSETNTVVIPHQMIGSLTTVDANLTYKFPDEAGLRKGLALTLSATNLFDSAPPYAKSPDTEYPGLNYDSLNASPIGRVVSFKINKKW